MKQGLIYKITSNTSKKSYIGQTVDFKSRIKRHENETSKTETHFGRAIRKYGWDDFCVGIIEYNIPCELLDERERYWIKHYNTFLNGYNSTSGAKGGNTYCKKTNEEMVEIKSKISKSNSGKNNGNKGQYIGSRNPMYGKHLSEETKAKISSKIKGRKDSDETRAKKSLASKGVKKNYFHPLKWLYLVQGNKVTKLSAKEIKDVLKLDNYINLKRVVEDKIVINGFRVIEGVETTENIA